MVSKKGNVIAEGFLLFVVIFVFALIVLFSYQIFKPVTDDILSSNAINESKAMASVVGDSLPSAYDSLFILAIGFFSLAGFIGAYYLDSSPFIYIMIIFLLIVCISIMAILSNTWEEITDEPSINFENKFPMTNMVLDNFVIFGIAYIILSGLVIYSGRG